MRMHLPRAAAALCAVLGAAPLLAHGGQYRGPSNVAPPSNTGSSSRSAPTASPSGGSGSTAGAPAAPPSAGPAAPAGAAVAGGGAPSRGSAARGAPVDDDLGRWEFWWEFGKDPFLRLRDAIHAASRSAEDDVLPTGRFAFTRAAVEPPRAADLDRVAQVLVATLRQARDRDTVSGCMIALAKIGRDLPGTTLADLFAPWLRGGDQELRETSALALGIAGQLRADVVDRLATLVRDDAAGRRSSGDVAVNERTRAFAAYACGLLLARAGADSVTATALAEPLLEIVAAPTVHGRELRVAATESLALLPRELADPAGKLLRARIVTTLGSWYRAELGPGERLLQAHVPTAIARLLPERDGTAAFWQQLFADDLRAGIDTAAGTTVPRRGDNLFVAQSCALALGSMTAPWNGNADGDADAAAARTLLDAYRKHRDQQTRSFALLALARIGGATARQTLLVELERSGRALEQPWCAMALGVLHARAVESAVREHRDPPRDREVAEALTRAFTGARNPSSIGALAIALGMAGDEIAADRLRDALTANRQRDDVAGYVALGLGLLRDRRAAAEIRSVLAASGRRPFLMMQCVRALGLIGDFAAAETLCAELERGDATLAKLSAAASALGQIGDRRSIDPLLHMLANEALTPLTRAFAAVALGSICDKDPLPWNHVFASFTNYRAATETLTDGAAGILDIL
jgi:hypothetical protein